MSKKRKKDVKSAPFKKLMKQPLTGQKGKSI